MKSRSFRFVAPATAGFLVMSFSTSAQEVTKENNTDALNLGSSWVGGTAPGAGNVALWNSTVTEANSTALGADTTWAGIKVLDPGGLVTIGTGANVLNLGTSGIDLSNATRSLHLNGASLNVGANDQTWNIGSSSYLRLGAGNLTGVLAGSGTITVSGSGIVDLNPNTTGAGNFSGKWVINSGATLRTTRNTGAALGSNTAADAVTLAGGTLAVGGFTGSGAQGNWAWANPVALAAGTSSTISGQLPDGTATARSLTLTGAITGSGNLTFSRNQPSTMDFIVNNLGTVAGARTNVLGTGDITVNGVTLTLRAGSTANAMTHNNNFSLTNAILHSDDAVQTHAGNISLTGANTIQGRWSGKNVILNGTISGTGSATFRTSNAADVVVFVNGDNTYGGGTTLGHGTANAGIVVAGHANAFGSGVLNIRGAQLRAGTAGLTIANDMTVANGGFRVGGANSFTLAGTLAVDGASRTVANYSSNGSTVTLGGISTVTGSVVAFDNAAGAATGAPIVVSGAISGAGAVALSGSHNTTLNGANTYSGPTTLSAGRLSFNGSSAAGSAWTVSGGTLSGMGTIGGTFAMSGGTLALAGGATTTGLTLNGGATFTNSPTVVFDSAPIENSVYDIFSYSGSLTGLSNLKLTSHRGTTSDTGTKYIFTAGDQNANRAWAGGSGTWDAGTTANWVEDDKLFFNGDHVTFGDTGSDAAVALSGSLTPASVTVGNSANVYTFSGGAIAGATSLIKNNAGTLVLSAVNTYTGGTTVNGGTLRLTASSGGSGTIRGALTANAGATIEIGGADVLGYSGGTVAVNAIHLDGATLVQTQDRNETSTAVIHMAGGSTIAATGGASALFDMFGGSAAINATGDAANTISSPIRLRQNDTAFNVSNGAQSVDLRVSGVISRGTEGNAAIVKNGEGTMLLSASNTFNGNLTVNGGVLELSSTGKLYNGGFNNSAVITVNNGGSWRMPDYSYAGVGQLADYAQRRVLNGGMIEVTGDSHSSGQDFTVTAQGGTFRYSASGQTLTLTGNDNTNTQLDGTLTFDTVGNIAVTGGSAILQGTGGLTKTGDGTLTLGAANTYTGATTVSEGTLFVTGALGNTIVTVESGAAIGGSGTLGGALAFNAGSILDLTGATLGLVSSDILSVTGSITLNDFGFTNLTGWNAATADNGTYTLINGGGTVTFAGTTPTALNPFDFGNGRQGYFQPGSLQAVIIPEPRAAMLGLLGMLALLRRRR